MVKVVSVHSFRGGTGKSNTTANVAAAIAASGYRVAILDTDIQSPGIHVLFGMDKNPPGKTLNNYLWEECAIADAAYDVSPDAVKQNNGSLYLVPSSSKTKDITRILKNGYDVGLLRIGIRDLAKALNLDFAFVDTHPGLNQETLVSIGTSNILVVVLRPDRQDFQGTSVTINLAQRLKVPKILVIVNRVLPQVSVEEVRQQIEAKYNEPVAGVFPNCDEMMQLASSDLFYVRHPDHPLTAQIQQVAEQIIN